MDAAALLEVLVSRRLIVSLAILGALVSAWGSYAMGGRSAAARTRARAVVLGGYAITGISVLAFVVAGFLADI